MDNANVVSLKVISRLLMITGRRVQQLASQEWIPKEGRGKYPLVGAVQGYIKFLQDEQSDQTKLATHNRAQEMRTREIELRVAEKEGQLIDLDEAMGLFEEITGDYISILRGLPAQITRDVRERTRLEKIIDRQCSHLSSRFSKKRKNLRKGRKASRTN